MSANLRLVMDINVMGVIYTSQLAQHYMRQSPKDALGPRTLLITASCGGFYPVAASPVYAASKHAMIGWTRSIAGRLWKEDGIRVNVSESKLRCVSQADNLLYQAICPGTVRTNLLSDDGWSKFPPEYFTPIEKVVEVVLMLVDNEKTTDGDNSGKPMVGQTVEISGKNHYFRTAYEFCDEPMAAVMKSTE